MGVVKWICIVTGKEKEKNNKTILMSEQSHAAPINDKMSKNMLRRYGRANRVKWFVF